MIFKQRQDEVREQFVQISGGRGCREETAGAKALVEDMPSLLEGIYGGQHGP